MPVHTVSKIPSKFKGRKARKKVHPDALTTTESYRKIALRPLIVSDATRSGTGAGPVLPNVPELANKPNR